MDDQTELPCVGKLTFNTQKEAAVSAVVVQYQHGTKVRPYTCKHCGLWHLTSDYDE